MGVREVVVAYLNLAFCPSVSLGALGKLFIYLRIYLTTLSLFSILSNGSVISK